MQITLTQAEIEQAISNFVTEQVNIREGHTLDIELKAGRGPEGYTATIDIVAPTDTVVPRRPAVKTETVAKAASEPEPETPDTTTAAVEEEQTGNQEEEVAAESAEAPKSIFKNLNRPRNN